MIELHTLGDAVITVGEKEVRPSSPMVFAALLYLCVERGRRVPRAALQELLFPETDERSGAHSLRQLLYKLRRLGVPLESDAESVAIVVSEISVEALDGLELDRADVLTRAAQPVLTGYAPRISAAFESWLESYRSGAATQIRRQLLTALAKARTVLNWTRVDTIANSILVSDPFNEEATLALAESLAMTGAKASALKILDRFEEETARQDLHLPASLLRRRISERSPASRLETAFVGRDADAAAIVNALSDRSSRRASLFVISGEAGIGKTRLLTELTELSALQGFNTQIVRCRSNYCARPLGVFIELVPALLACPGAIGVSPASLTFLRYLTARASLDAERIIDARDEATRSRALLHAVRDLVHAVKAESPLLIAVEDVHWSDADSLNELHHLSGLGVRVLVTTRELSALSKTIDLTHAVIRKLRPLDEPALRAMAFELLGEHASERMLDWLVRTAAGNPLFLKTLCAHYEATRTPFSVPPSLVTATTARIEQLSADARRILELCAMLGRHTTVSDLSELAGRSRADLLGDVERLELDGYLQLRNDIPSVSHDLLAECTLALLPPLTKRLLHGCVAANLQRRYELFDDVTLLWDCTDHWVASGEGQNGLEFLIQCAKHAANMGKSEHALRILEGARRVAKSRTDIKRVLSETMFIARSANDWGLVYTSGRTLRDSLGEDLSHSDVELVDIEGQWNAKTTTDACHRLLSCVFAKEATKDHRIDAACLLLKAATESADLDLAQSAYSAVEQLLDPRSTRYSERVIPLLFHTVFGEPAIAIDAARQLLRDCESISGLGGRLRVGLTTGQVFSFLGHYDESFQIAHRYWQRIEKSGLTTWSADFCCVACAAKILARRFEEAEEWYKRSSELPVSTGTQSFAQLANAIELALWKRDVSRVQTLCQGGLARAGESKRFHGYLIGAWTRAKQLDESYRSSTSEIAELRRSFEATKTLACVDGLTLALCEALRRTGRRSEALLTLNRYLQSERRERTGPPSDLTNLQAELVASTIA